MRFNIETGMILIALISVLTIVVYLIWYFRDKAQWRQYMNNEIWEINHGYREMAARKKRKDWPKVAAEERMALEKLVAENPSPRATAKRIKAEEKNNTYPNYKVSVEEWLE